MSVFEIPISTNGASLFTIEATLEGSVHRFRFDWNGREARWYCSWIGHAMGRKILPGWPIFRRVTEALDGQVQFSNIAPDQRPPGFDELGTRTRMIYIEPVAP